MPASRLFAAFLLAAFSALAFAQAQKAPAAYEPTVGQEGKDVVWVPTPQAVVDKLNAEYGEGAPRGRGPDQGRVQMEGNAYLTRDFGKLDFVKKATIDK